MQCSFCREILRANDHHRLLRNYVMATQAKLIYPVKMFRTVTQSLFPHILAQ